MEPSVVGFLQKIEFAFILVFIFIIPIFFLVQIFRTPSSWQWCKRLGLFVLAVLCYEIFLILSLRFQWDHYLVPERSPKPPIWGFIIDWLYFCGVCALLGIAPLVVAKLTGLFRPPTRLLFYCAGFLWAAGIYFIFLLAAGS